jgi:hypothetical protein
VTFDLAAELGSYVVQCKWNVVSFLLISLIRVCTWLHHFISFKLLELQLLLYLHSSVDFCKQCIQSIEISFLNSAKTLVMLNMKIVFLLSKSVRSRRNLIELFMRTAYSDQLVTCYTPTWTIVFKSITVFEVNSVNTEVEILSNSNY